MLGNFDSQSGILPSRSLPETLKSVVELKEDEMLADVRVRPPVNELNSSRRVSKVGS